MTVTNCICIKYGTRYGPEYPNRLYAGLRRQSSSGIRLYCLTDDRTGLRPEIEVLPLLEEAFYPTMFAEMARRGWKSPFRKVSLFRPGLIADLVGPLLILDLDIVVVGDVAELATFAPGKVAMRREWNSKPGRVSFGHGSVEKIEPDLHGWLYEDVARDPVSALKLGQGSEQSYTSTNAHNRGALEHFPDDWIASFKYDCRPPRPLNLILQPKLPPTARVICFHGAPKMEDAVSGYRAGPFRSTRPCAWLRDTWMGDEP